MDYVNICQLCSFCKKGSHVFKVHLNYFDDQTGEVLIDPMGKLFYNFKCTFCSQTSVLDFGLYCPPCHILQIKK